MNRMTLCQLTIKRKQRDTYDLTIKRANGPALLTNDTNLHVISAQLEHNQNDMETQ